MAKCLRFLMAFFVVFLFVSAGPIGQSNSETFFGPIICTRSTSIPVIENFEFYAHGYEAPYILHLQNGDEDGTHRTSSGQVWLNGKQIFTPSDFKKKVAGYTKQVTLNESNTLSVRLTSHPGSHIKIWIEGIAAAFRPEVILDTEHSASRGFVPEDAGSVETVGADGTKYNLTVPANALNNQTEIKITPVTMITGLPSNFSAFAAVQMEPDGLRLMKPATLTIELPYALQNEIVGFLFQNNGEGFHLYPTKVDGNKLIFNLIHFTTAGATTADCAELAEFDVQNWITQEDRAMQRISILAARYYWCEGTEYELDLNTAAQLLMEIHYTWFIEGIRPIIEEAKGNPEVFLDRAISLLDFWFFSSKWDDLAQILQPDLYSFDTPYNWGGNICNDLYDLSMVAADNISKALKVAVTNANNRCISGGQSQDDEAMYWIEKACWLEGFSSMEIRYGFYVNYHDLVDLKTCGTVAVEIDPAEITTHACDAQQLRLYKLNSKGERIGEVATDRTEWRSKDESSGVYVDQNGMLFVGESQGTFTIDAWVTMLGQCVLWDTETTVTVGPPEIIDVWIDYSSWPIQVPLGGTVQLTASVYSSCGPVPDAEVNWTSDAWVTTVDYNRGVILGVCNGRGWVRASYGGENRTETVSVGTGGPADVGGQWTIILSGGSTAQLRIRFSGGPSGTYFIDRYLYVYYPPAYWVTTDTGTYQISQDNIMTCQDTILFTDPNFHDYTWGGMYGPYWGGLVCDHQIRDIHGDWDAWR